MLKYELIKKKLVGLNIDLFNLTDQETLDYIGTFCKVDTLTINHIRLAKKKSIDVIESCKSNEIKILCIDDDNFPIILKKIQRCPFLLYYKGNIKSLNNKTKIAVVGTRKPTKFGALMSNHIAKELAMNDITVVSGLAMGIDTNAHEGCLEVSGCTIAVMPCGLDKIVPKMNENLAYSILEKNGCLLSEYPPNTKVYASNYINRNKIQSGLSSGVIIVETDLKGGTMHTAGFAQKNKRNIGVFFKIEDSSFNKGGQNIIVDSKFSNTKKLFSIIDLLNFIDDCKKFQMKNFQQLDFLVDFR
jgi:DNA processing protein